MTETTSPPLIETETSPSDVNHLLESFAALHPEFVPVGSSSEVVKSVLLKRLNQTLENEISKTKEMPTASHRLTDWAENLSAPAAFGMLAAAAAPEIPLLALAAAGVGYGLKKLLDLALEKQARRVSEAVK